MTLAYSHSTGKITALGRDMPATCKVRNELNGLRKPNQVVKSMTREGGIGVPYQPRIFPMGTWHVVAVIPKTDPYMAPFFISTDASQIVDEWALDSQGAYLHAIGQTDDHGYGLHNSTSETTLGCIRIISPQDLLDLVAAIRLAWTTEESVTLTVTA